MAVKIPWLMLACCGVPLFMIYTKSLRMDAREFHEISMRVKYYSEYWEKGNAFAAQLRRHVDDSITSSADPLLGRDIAAISEDDWRLAGRRAAEEAAAEEARRTGKSSSTKRFFIF